MSTFIAKKIIEKADRSTEEGQKKYRAYFVKQDCTRNGKKK